MHTSNATGRQEEMPSCETKTTFRGAVHHKPYPITGSPFTPSLPCAPHLCRQKHIPDPTNPGKYVYAYSPCVPIDCSTTGANDADSHVSVEDEIHVYESEIEHSESILNIDFVHHLADDNSTSMLYYIFTYC